MQLNHVFKTRDLVLKNDAKMAKHKENAKDEMPNDSFLDQGFTRPKVVMLIRLLAMMPQHNLIQTHDLWLILFSCLAITT